MNIIFGDIHGCFYTLEKLLHRVHKLDPNAKLIFIGDYVDRGHHNKEVVDLLLSLQKEGAVCLRGNHDNVIDWILNDGHFLGNIHEFVRGSPRAWNVMSWWNYNGLGETLASYGCRKQMERHQSTSYSLDWEAIRQEFVEKCPDDHKQFFHDLPIFWESETHFACHAFYRPGEELPRDFKFVLSDRIDEVLWSRFSMMHLTHQTRWDRIGVFGHTPVKGGYGSEVPIKWDKIRLIDTGAFTGEYLCAYLCEADDHILQLTDSRDKLSSYITQEVDLK